MMLLTSLVALVLAAVDDAPINPPAPESAWSLSLPDAYRIGLTNTPVVRVVATGTRGVPPVGYSPLNGSAANLLSGSKDLTGANVPPVAPGPHAIDLMIASVSSEAPSWELKAALLAHLRSVEQTYWGLASVQISRDARETAVRLGEEILKRVKADAAGGRGNAADVAEAEQQLENFRLNLVTATSDVATAERQLRNILGASASDPRRIIPTTPPVVAKAEPAWDASQRLMAASQPEISAQRELLAAAALKEAFLLDNSSLTETLRTKARQDRERQQAYLREVIQTATHVLARSTLEVDSNFKQFEISRRLKDAAQKRLAAQQVYAAEGQITVDRLLDAVSQQANAIGQEGMSLMMYNTALASLEEAQGTLLDRAGVTIVVPTNAPAPVAAQASSPAPSTKLRVSVAGIKLLDVEVERTAAPASPR